MNYCDCKHVTYCKCKPETCNVSREYQVFNRDKIFNLSHNEIAKKQGIEKLKS